MACILVIHGFNSGPGEKSKFLEEQFPDIKVFTPQLKNSPIADLALLQEFLDQNSDVHVVGTSMGGFLGLILSLRNSNRDDVSFYLINPSFAPADSFARRIGENTINYKTAETFEIDANFVSELRQLQTELHANLISRPNNTWFYFSLQDEVLNHDALRNRLLSLRVPVNIAESEQDHRHSDMQGVLYTIRMNMSGYFI